MQLVIEEPNPGAYLWALIETDARGVALKTVRRADDVYDTYETALAVGTRRLNAELRARAPQGAASP